jgi:predicted nucleotidyltransferase component of viral defense system
LKKPVKNVAASVRQRLLNLAHERNESFDLVLTKFGLERLLYRISRSPYRNKLVLKGALLFELWTEQRYRPTRDADFLARSDNSPAAVTAMFRDICSLEAPDDGVQFDPATVKAERIIEDADYEGIRVTFMGYLENARIPIQVDLGFGDVVTPGTVETEIPPLLDMPAPKLLTYPRETVIAEKFEAVVSLGMANSRMKDLYDIASLGREFSFDGAVLTEAIRRTFEVRRTELPAGKPVAFTPEFFGDETKRKQWAAFKNRNRAFVKDELLEAVCRQIESFLLPIVQALALHEPFQKQWRAGGLWQ